jgi:predicted small secreted protein
MSTTRRKRRLLFVLQLLVAGLAASILMPGCNTVEGVGEDIEATGDALEGAADDDAD